MAFETNILVLNSRRSFFFSFKNQQCELSKNNCAWSSELNEFEKKCALSLEPNDFMQIIESNKVRLEFKPRIVEFRTLGDTHFLLD